MSWPIKSLSEVADFRLGKMLDQRKNKGDLLPYLANKNVRWGEFDLSELREMRFEEKEFETFSLKNGDIVMCEGGVPGRCAIWRDQIPKMMYQKALHRIRPNEGMNEVYLYYNLSHRAKSGHFEGLFTGSTIKHLPKEKLALVQVDVPDLPTQERIATILSAYDDLIENNRRKIALLEQAARLLYREWFVHFRFPGHETARFVDGLPEGWEQKTFDEVCQTIGGGTPSTKVAAYWDDGDVPWITPTDITRNDCLALLDGEKKITREGLIKSSAKMVPPHTILMTSRASVGFFGLADKEVCTNQGFINIIPNVEVMRYCLLFNLLHRVEEIRSHAGGSTYAEISKSKFRALSVVQPDADALDIFDAKVRPMLDQVRSLKKNTQQLTKARDLLLPRLMDGRIPVKV